MPRDADELVELLDLETIDTNLFRGRQAVTSLPRVFGGQAAAQAVVAAGRTVDPAYALHSLHSYFLQPGDTSTPTIYDVETIRESRSFATRRVLARQHGRPIYALTADFQRPEESWEHQQAAPTVPPPEECLDPKPLLGQAPDDPEWGVMDVRYVGTSADDALEPDDVRPGRQRVWLRARGRLPDDPFVHLAVFTYFSDMFLMGSALAPHGIRAGSREAMIASLDHAVWFHRPFRADEWWLYDQDSPFAGGGRGLVHGRVHTPDGTLVASVSQEALLRKPRPQRPTASEDA
ncbi:acyl-CoA thioesterase II [Nocardioides sp. SOB77]|uniref:Acyl-CoA thioesterase II n=1 Tax=Nocardioides oceani TaxID=3058369 RepID=A0ABT8FL99_9ACTN|nr:acyl-CoA thioesterase II [Nocardioides oceani]MDN4175300.1 acyl-CoA thioesterase II [Nocardioides oceani]